jgi:hypothetical protein
VGPVRRPSDRAVLNGTPFTKLNLTASGDAQITTKPYSPFAGMERETGLQPPSAKIAVQFTYRLSRVM